MQTQHYLHSVEPAFRTSTTFSHQHPITPKLFGETAVAAPHVAAIAALTLNMAPCLLSSSGTQLPAVSREILYEALTGGYAPGLTPPTSTSSFPSNYASSLSTYLLSLPNNVEGYGVVDALTTTSSLLPISAVGSTSPTSATSMNGAPVLLKGNAGMYNPSNCQPVAIQWSGACGTGAMGATQASVQCPIGVDLVTASVSLNGSSFLPQVQIPPFNVIVTDFVLSSSVYSGSSGAVTPGTPALYVINVSSLGSGPFTNPVSLSCLNPPAGAICQFSPQTVAPTMTATSVTSTLTIYTSGQSA